LFSWVSFCRYCRFDGFSRWDLRRMAATFHDHLI